MVKRLQSGRLAAIDLDGTLVRGNTLHEYIRLGLGQELRDGRLWNAVCIAGMLGLRCMRLVSHRRMKFTAVRHIRPTERLRQRFARRIDSMRNSYVAGLIEQFRASGAEVILATAAPDVYVPWIWEGDFVATRMQDNPGMEEMRGHNKLAAVLEYCRCHNLELYGVVTDHEDDRPLLDSGAERCILIR